MTSTPEIGVTARTNLGGRPRWRYQQRQPHKTHAASQIRGHGRLHEERSRDGQVMVRVFDVQAKQMVRINVRGWRSHGWGPSARAMQVSPPVTAQILLDMQQRQTRPRRGADNKNTDPSSLNLLMMPREGGVEDAGGRGEVTVSAIVLSTFLA